MGECETLVLGITFMILVFALCAMMIVCMMIDKREDKQ